MDVLEQARRLEAQGRRVLHLEVGDPDFATPPPAVEAAKAALDAGLTHYTESLGLPALREAIARRYRARHGIDVSPGRVVVGSGSSPLLMLLFLAILEPGDEVLVADPGYSCYPNFVRAADGVPVRADAAAASGWRLTVGELERRRTARTRAVIINSPANPTGVVYGADELERLVRWATGEGLWVIADEIYHGLSAGHVEPTALAWDVEGHVVVVDGFSKRYAMTGWRLGWAVVPEHLVRPMQKLQQNLMVCPPAVAQHAGAAALEHAEAYVQAMAEELARRRRVLLEGLGRLGWPVAGRPEGAFYVLAGVPHLGRDSRKAAFDILERTGVALTPGIDFGPAAEGHLRFSYAAGVETIGEALERLTALAAPGGGRRAGEGEPALDGDAASLVSPAQGGLPG